MIAPATVDEILQLLGTGQLSQRKIARQLGVSRGTVNALAQGKRPARLPGQLEAEDFTPPAGPPRRCPGCGGMVFMPCLLCHVRAMSHTPRAAAD